MGIKDKLRRRTNGNQPLRDEIQVSSQQRATNTPTTRSSISRDPWDAHQADQPIRIILPRGDISVTSLLISLGAHLTTEVTKTGKDQESAGSNLEHYQVFELPETLTLESGYLTRENEFNCTLGNAYSGVIPSIIRSKDGQVVLAHFETIKGTVTQIGPTWSGILDKFTPGEPTPILPEEVYNVEMEPGFEIPNTKDWKLLIAGITDLGMYPVKDRCMKDFMARGASKQDFEDFLESISDHFRAISFERGRNFQAILNPIDRSETPTIELDSI